MIATGRSDYPNQINNVLAFPGIFRGALDVRASAINEAMKLAAAHAIAAVVKPDELGPEYIVPSVFNRDVAPAVAAAVSAAAEQSGLAQRRNVSRPERPEAGLAPGLRRFVGGKARSGAASRTSSAPRGSTMLCRSRAHLRAVARLRAVDQVRQAGRQVGQDRRSPAPGDLAVRDRLVELRLRRRARAR